MSQYVDGNYKSFQASAAIALHLRVYITGGKLAAAGATQREIGTMFEAALAADEWKTVKLASAAGTCKMIAAGAITAGTDVYAAASGKVNDVASGVYIGVALETVTAANDVIEVLRLPGESQHLGLCTWEAHTAGDTLTAAESGSGHTNTGASGAVTLVLPAATAGLHFWFAVGAAQELRLDPNGTETISLPSTGVPGAAGKYLTANAIGETVHLVCAIAGNWAVYGYTGTWTAEA